MRIVFLAHHGSIHTRRWAAFFADRGHDVHVITCGDGEPVEGGYHVHDVGAPSPPKSGYLVRVPATRLIARRLQPDLVHAHHATSYGLLGLLAGIRPLVVTSHGSDVLLGRHHLLYRVILRYVLRAAAIVTVPSPEIREAVRDLSRRPLDVEMFQYGVDSARLFRLAERARRGDHVVGCTIVSARPFEPVYRHDVTIDALARFAERRDDWVGTFYGGGSVLDEMRERAATVGLTGRVHFAGDRPVSEVEDALSRAQLYVSCSESDGASVALLEAMALGAVPIVSDIPSNRAWVRDGENGILTAIEPSAVANGIERALALDGGRVALANRAIVAERADRHRNLGRLEARLLTLVERARH